ncbi:uncharacterized protein JCM15063_002637 [Sporobolomyces koalae]|uniref:uncharacterized protein n=1 Tax=Sporobolomyces koalae TaxID=500713 RepID=UPI00317BD997
MDFLDLTLSSEDELDRSSPPLRSHGINPTSSDTRTQASTGARNLPANLLAFGGGSSNSLDRRVAHTPVAGTSDSRIPSANKGKGREIESIILSSDDEDPPHKEEQPRPALHPRFRHGLTHGSGKRHSQPDITLSSSSEPESSHQPQSQSQSRETQFPTSQQLLERSRAIARLSQAYLEGALAHAVGQQSARPPDSQRLHMASKAASRVGTKLDPASPSTIPDRNGSPASATASSASQPFNLGGRSNGKDDGTVTSEVTNTVGITFLSPVDSTHFSQAPNKSHVDSEKPPRLKATARKSNRGRPFQFTDFPLSHAAAALQSGSTDGSRKRAASEALSPDMNDGSHAATLDSPADAIGQTSLANKRRATEDSEEAGPKKTRRRRRRRKRDPPPETASLVEGEASTRLEIATSKNAPTTAEAMPPFVKATHLAVDEDTFKRQQKELPSYKRQIAGPSYDISLEFPQTIQTSVYRRERQWKKAHPEGEAPLRDGYKLLFEQMIYDANSKEFPPRLQPKIRVCPPEDALATDWSSPFFEICYTNRIVYADGIVPKQAPGCDCIGNCGDPRNREGCGCRKRQIAASRTRRGGSDRSNHSDFAYNAEGLLNDSLFAHNDPIIECNSQCGCGETCINRVIGSQKATSIDIFHTGDKGWGIRNPLSFHDSLLGTYQERTIRKGEPLGVYAGELLLSQEADERDKLVYRKTQRCYTYALDPWTVGEDYRALVQKVEPSHLKVASALRSAHKTTTATSCAKKSAARKLQRMKAESIGSQTTAFGETAEDDGYSAVFSVDAFSYGNWTRFANHVCQDFNVVPRSIYIDDADITRPLWVYVALRDIPPGEEINISYFSESEPRPQDHGLKREDWRKCADKLREEMPKTFRCYCRKELCRGVMFNLPDPDNEFFFNRPT